MYCVPYYAEIRPPKIVDTNPKKEKIYVNPGDMVSLFCEVDAFPSAITTWRNSIVSCIDSYLFICLKALQNTMHSYALYTIP